MPTEPIAVTGDPFHTKAEVQHTERAYAFALESLLFAAQRHAAALDAHRRTLRHANMEGRLVGEAVADAALALADVDRIMAELRHTSLSGRYLNAKPWTPGRPTEVTP